MDGMEEMTSEDLKGLLQGYEAQALYWHREENYTNAKEWCEHAKAMAEWFDEGAQKLRQELKKRAL